MQWIHIPKIIIIIIISVNDETIGNQPTKYLQHKHPMRNVSMTYRPVITNQGYFYSCQGEYEKVM